MSLRSPRLWALFFGGLTTTGTVSAERTDLLDVTHSNDPPDRSAQPSSPASEGVIPNKSGNEGTPSLTLALSRSIPALLSPMLSMLPMGGLGEWLVLFAVGGFLGPARQWVSGSCERLLKSTYRTVTIEGNEPGYRWMLSWLSEQPSWVAAQSMDARVMDGPNPPTSHYIMGEAPLRSTSDNKSIRPVGFLPSPNQRCSLWWRGRYIWVERNSVKPEGDQRPGPRFSLTISMFTRDVDNIRSLIYEAGERYMEKKGESVHCFITEFNGMWHHWKHVSCTPRRSMDSIVLESGIKDLLLEDAREFLGSQDWYAARGIPYRRGYLLHGVPGSGKTSVIHSLAGELGLDVYLISLSRSQLDDTQLSNIINDLPERCIALMEDIDAAFTQDLNRDAPNTSESSPMMSARMRKFDDAGSRVTLSGLLNALDGVGAHEGRILFATTNKYSSLDPALCRPGRMDIHIEFKNASKWQAKELFRRFYHPEDSSSSGTANIPALATVKSESEKPMTDPAGAEKASLQPPSSESSVTVFSEWLSTKIQTPSFTSDELQGLATQFADAIPDQEFSMACLQGYLMLYKTRPQEAVSQADAWIEKIRT